MPFATAPLLLVSPHLDDAVLSCGDVLASRPGTLVATCFTAVPGDPAMSTDWDRTCGYADAAQAMASRIAEDRRALGILHARALHLGFLDRQYGDSPGVPALAARLAGLLAAGHCAAVLIPLGLHHPDHDLVHRACMAVLPLWTGLAWLAYEDSPYRRVEGVVQQRLAQLLAQGVLATPARLPAGRDSARYAQQGPLVQSAVQAYSSQLTAFDAHDRADFAQPGRYWRLSPRPAAAG